MNNHTKSDGRRTVSGVNENVVRAKHQPARMVEGRPVAETTISSSIQSRYCSKHPQRGWKLHIKSEETLFKRKDKLKDF